MRQTTTISRSSRQLAQSVLQLRQWYESAALDMEIIPLFLGAHIQEEDTFLIFLISLGSGQLGCESGGGGSLGNRRGFRPEDPQPCDHEEAGCPGQPTRPAGYACGFFWWNGLLKQGVNGAYSPPLGTQNFGAVERLKNKRALLAGAILTRKKAVIKTAEAKHHMHEAPMMNGSRKVK